jgi:hypothetical protein
VTARTTRAFQRAEEEARAGRAWKALDRLRGLLVQFPADQDLLSRIGELHYAMGELPEAGRYWWLTELDDDAAHAARAAFHERYGNTPPTILAALPHPGTPELYPPGVRARLERLLGTTSVGGARRGEAIASAGRRRPDRLRQTFWAATCGFVALVMLVVFVAGIAAIAGTLLQP